jgi:hypothetical protein
MCRFFTQLGVDVHATNNRGATPAEIGKSRHNAEVAAALGGPPAPSAPTLYSKGAKCLTIEWMPVPHVDSGRVIYEVSGKPGRSLWQPFFTHFLRCNAAQTMAFGAWSLEVLGEIQSRFGVPLVAVLALRP